MKKKIHTDMFYRINTTFRNRIGTLLLLCCFTVKGTLAQTPSSVMENVYKRYDSTMFLSFDVKYTLGSDTLLGDFTHEVMQGTFTMAGKKTKYKLGDVEFMQNDSLFIAVYNNEKYIVISNPRVSNSGSQLPLRDMMDSLLQTYSPHYTINIDSPDTHTGRIKFVKADTLATFLDFKIAYDLDQYILRSVSYSFEEPPQLDTIAFLPAMRRKTMTIEFSNYRGDNYLDDAYDTNAYVFFEDGLFKPVARYRDYKVFNSRTGQY